MDLKKLFNSNKAVSPVIGVVLMVAITVILAAAIGSSVFGQGPAKSAPQANINVMTAGQDKMKLEHLGGDSINFDPAVTKIMFEIDGESQEVVTDAFNNTDNTAYLPFEVGMTQTLDLPADTTSPGDFATVKIVDVETKQLIAQKELRF